MDYGGHIPYSLVMPAPNIGQPGVCQFLFLLQKNGEMFGFWRMSLYL